MNSWMHASNWWIICFLIAESFEGTHWVSLCLEIKQVMANNIVGICSFKNSKEKDIVYCHVMG